MPEDTERFIVPGSDTEDDHLTAYCNSIAIAHTLFDFQFNFIEMRIVDDLASKADLFATIMMSPQHAKVMSKSLETNLRLYEEQFGEITLPEGAYQHITKTVGTPKPKDES
jgi:hypothetical protein